MYVHTFTHRARQPDVLEVDGDGGRCRLGRGEMGLCKPSIGDIVHNATVGVGLQAAAAIACAVRDGGTHCAIAAPCQGLIDGKARETGDVTAATSTRFEVATLRHVP